MIATLLHGPPRGGTPDGYSLAIALGMYAFVIGLVYLQRWIWRRAEQREDREAKAAAPNGDRMMIGTGADQARDKSRLKS